jgi:RNA polymerase sigma-70 factor (ECF subfamily)
VQSRRKRFEPVDPALTTEITARFFVAASTGDMDSLLEVLAADGGVDRRQ